MPRVALPFDAVELLLFYSSFNVIAAVELDPSLGTN